MVNIIENWANVRGVVKAVGANPRLSGYTLVDLDLKVSASVESFPNLAKLDEGKTIRVNVRTRELEQLSIRPGATVSWIVRKARDQIYFMK